MNIRLLKRILLALVLLLSSFFGGVDCLPGEGDGLDPLPIVAGFFLGQGALFVNDSGEPGASDPGNENRKLKRFEIFQTISTQGAQDREFFTIDDESYLAVANFFNGTTRNLNSIIYKAVFE